MEEDGVISFKSAILRTLGILFIILELIVLAYFVNTIISINANSNNIKSTSCYSRELWMIFAWWIFITMVVMIIVLILVRIHNRKIDDDNGLNLKFFIVIFTIIILTFLTIFLGMIIVSIINLSGSETAKPVIYLYPTEEKEISVKLLYDDMLTVSYPKYTKKWNVLAKEDGALVDLSTNRNLYSLYYECKNKNNYKVEKDGFVIKGEDSATFLEEKLAILGLTQREAEEFIIYWLPILEANKYNYIRFATLDEIEANMPLEITPTPDTVIRIVMTFKSLKKPIYVEEQKLITPDRIGFVAVEWGGSEIK